MYWQVYYHKTVLAVEYMLISILNRARELVKNGRELPCSSALKFFLSRQVSKEQFNASADILKKFAALDDYDIHHAVKEWSDDSDPILSLLCKSLMNRKLFRVVINTEPFTAEKTTQIKNRIIERLKLNGEEYKYFIGQGEISNSAYDPGSDRITIVDKKGERWDISGLSEQLNIAVYNKTVSKFFTYFPKWADL
jgi:hypothetical protein